MKFFLFLVHLVRECALFLVVGGFDVRFVERMVEAEVGGSLLLSEAGDWFVEGDVGPIGDDLTLGVVDGLLAAAGDEALTSCLKIVISSDVVTLDGRATL